MKKVILTLVLGVAAAASAQTSNNGSNWLGAAWPNKEPEQAWRQCVMQALDKKVVAAKSASDIAAASAQTSGGGDAQCANSTYGKYWVATTYGGYCASSPATPSASAQASNWLDAACPNKEPIEAWRQCAIAAVSAKAEARESTFNEQVAQQQQQAEYQRQLLQQLAEHQQQLLKQQGDIARR